MACCAFTVGLLAVASSTRGSYPSSLPSEREASPDCYPDSRGGYKEGAPSRLGLGFFGKASRTSQKRPYAYSSAERPARAKTPTAQGASRREIEELLNELAPGQDGDYAHMSESLRIALKEILLLREQLAAQRRNSEELKDSFTDLLEEYKNAEDAFKMPSLSPHGINYMFEFLPGFGISHAHRLVGTEMSGLLRGLMTRGK
eukprot:jgi/Bigna1/126353/aug1.2_g1061